MIESALARRLLRRILVPLVAFLAIFPTLRAVPAAAAPSGAATSGAVVVGETKVADRQVDLDVRSTALGRTVKVRLLTPDGWDHRSPNQTWPVLYLLHGCCGDYTSWTAMTDVARIPRLRHVLVVMPEAGDTGWYSDWWNYGNGGAPAWETFHLRELRPLLEEHYGAGTRRVVAGLSMGGLGALLYAGRHPGMFRAAASFSGMVDPLAPNGPGWIDYFMSSYGYDPLRLWGDPTRQRAIWEAHDPAYLSSNLARIPVFLSCGNGTPGELDAPNTGFNQLEADFLVENENTAAAIRRAGGARLTTDFYGNGTHAWAYWQRELHRSLPMLLKALHGR